MWQLGSRRPEKFANNRRKPFNCPLENALRSSAALPRAIRDRFIRDSMEARPMNPFVERPNAEESFRADARSLWLPLARRRPARWQRWRRTRRGARRSRRRAARRRPVGARRRRSRYPRRKVNRKCKQVLRPTRNLLKRNGKMIYRKLSDYAILLTFPHLVTLASSCVLLLVWCCNNIYVKKKERKYLCFREVVRGSIDLRRWSVWRRRESVEPRGGGGKGERENRAKIVPSENRVAIERERGWVTGRDKSQPATD